ncbi:aspartate/glutamate racemase family protein [Streptomyces sp. NPDC004609]|uniref:aspartate/glutamate racemase family protein n=1 Tax=Streptomyces sp. NPDC004609 TaxID=3364704 RepID=UPI00369BF0DE
MIKRIAYLTSPGPTDRRGVAPEIVTPGFQMEFVQIGTPTLVNDPADLMITDLAYVEAAMRAQRQGFDGIVIGAVADYGLGTIRASVDIPVFGCGQAGLLTAAGIGDKFGIVTIWPETTAFTYDRILRDNPVGRQCVSVRYVSTVAEQAEIADEDGFYQQMQAGREGMMLRILAEIEAAVAEGAQSIVLGCNCMSPVAGILAARSSVPVIDPTAAGYRSLESMLLLGLTHAKDPRLPAVSERGPAFAEAVAAVVGTLDEPEECPVCVLDEYGNASCEAPSHEAAPTSADGTAQ